MASGNLELVRSIFAAWELGDFSSAQWAHPEIEYVFADGPHPGRWVGLAAMASAYRDFLSAWDGWRIEAEEYRALDEERVLVFTRMSGRGTTSGLELTRMRDMGANLFQLCSGKVTRLALYWDRSHALAELGLDPQDDPAGCSGGAV
jgi:ketosteroid isomerase-like protein